MSRRNGWFYSADDTFRQRFPEWERIAPNVYQLFVQCEELIDGRWEGFLSTPSVFWENGEIVDLKKRGEK